MVNNFEAFTIDFSYEQKMLANQLFSDPWNYYSASKGSRTAYIPLFEKDMN